MLLHCPAQDALTLITQIGVRLNNKAFLFFFFFFEAFKALLYVMVKEKKKKRNATDLSYSKQQQIKSIHLSMEDGTHLKRKK